MKKDSLDKILNSKLRDFSPQKGDVPSWDHFVVSNDGIKTEKKLEKYIAKSDVGKSEVTNSKINRQNILTRSSKTISPNFIRKIVAATVAAAVATTIALMVNVDRRTVECPDVLAIMMNEINAEIIPEPNLVTHKSISPKSAKYIEIKTERVFDKNTYYNENLFIPELGTEIKQLQDQSDILDKDDSSKNVTPQNYPETDISGDNQIERKVYIEDLILENQTEISKVKSRNRIKLLAYSGLSSSGLANDDDIHTKDLAVIQAGGAQSVISFNVGELKHKAPIGGGIWVDVPLTKKLALNSGVNYSYLESYRKSSQTKYTQKIHYLGIPLRVNYKFVNTKIIDVYAATGALAEIALVAKAVKETFPESELRVVEKENLNVNGLQMSVNAGVGINLHISRNIGFYVEPGVTHYFKNSNHPKTSRTNTDVQFNLNSGFKFQF